MHRLCCSPCCGPDGNSLNLWVRLWVHLSGMFLLRHRGEMRRWRGGGAGALCYSSIKEQCLSWTLVTVPSHLWDYEHEPVEATSVARRRVERRWCRPGEIATAMEDNTAIIIRARAGLSTVAGPGTISLLAGCSTTKTQQLLLQPPEMFQPPHLWHTQWKKRCYVTVCSCESRRVAADPHMFFYSFTFQYLSVLNHINNGISSLIWHYNRFMLLLLV